MFSVYSHADGTHRMMDEREAIVTDQHPDSSFCSGCGWNLDNDDIGICGCDFM